MLCYVFNILKKILTTASEKKKKKKSRYAVSRTRRYSFTRYAVTPLRVLLTIV